MKTLKKLSTILILGVIVIVSSKKSKAQDVVVTPTPPSTPFVFEISNSVNNKAINKEVKELFKEIQALRAVKSNMIQTKLYPNPSAGMLNIAVEELPAGEVNIKILDLEGNEVYASSASQYEDGAFQATIDATDLVDGIYKVIISSDTYILHQKWTKGL